MRQATQEQPSYAHVDSLIKARLARERRKARSIADRYCTRDAYVPQRDEPEQEPER